MLIQSPGSNDPESPNRSPNNLSYSADVTYNTAKSITLDSVDSDGDSLEYVLQSSPTNGDLSGEAPEFTYTPDTDFLGADSFSFRVSDGVNEAVDVVVTVSVNPFGISTCQDLQEIPDDSDLPFQLTQDIDCSETSSWNSGAGFIPIVNYQGNFDGNNKIISDLFMDAIRVGGVGIFATVENAKFKDLGIVNINVTGVSKWVGGLIGVGRNVEIDRVFLTGSVSGDVDAGDPDSGWSTGGIVGYIGSQAGSIVRDSFVRATISGADDYTGSLAGVIEAGANKPVIRSYGAGNLSLKYGSRSGGITCYTWSDVIDSFSATNVHAAKGFFGTNTNNWSSVAGTVVNVATGGANDFKGDVFTSGKEPFQSWDFSDVWEEVDADFPRLKGFNYPSPWY